MQALPLNHSIDQSISVVVPSYNHAQFVTSCLHSIINQTLKPAKLLVIDDGSTDDSPRVIETVLKECPFPCELIARENRGLPATLNQGLKLTSGKYFAYLSSDDMWLETFLAARLNLLQNRPTAILAYGHSFFISEQGNVVDFTGDWADYKDGNVKEMLLQTIGPMSPTVVYLREPLTMYGWNEAARLEDYELYLKLSLKGEFAFDPQPLSAWRVHKTNTSWNQHMMLEEHENALRSLSSHLGIDGADLEKLLRAIRFKRSEDFLRIGEKREAVSLALRNFSAPEASQLPRILVRLLIPHSTLSWWRKRKRAKAMQRFESLRFY